MMVVMSPSPQKPCSRVPALAVVLLVACGASPVPANPPAVEPSAPAIVNFRKVDDRLYRGGQPSPGSMAALRALGVRTVVNLRYEDAVVAAEEAEARTAGLRYVNIPMYGLLRPKQEQIERILALVDDPESAPVFVHCKAGHDRTGAVVACYRVARTKWTAEQAIREALDLGMMKIEFAKRAFVREFYEALQVGAGSAASAGAPSPPLP